MTKSKHTKLPWNNIVKMDGSAEELQNSIIELQSVGQLNAAKQIFQGNIFYRSDTGKCMRCLRYRPEIFYDNENLKCESDCCDRCKEVIK
jgi:hypothetical protein